MLRCSNYTRNFAKIFFGFGFKKMTGGSAKKSYIQRANSSTYGEVGVPSINFGGGGRAMRV